MDLVYGPRAPEVVERICRDHIGNPQPGQHLGHPRRRSGAFPAQAYGAVFRQLVRALSGNQDIVGRQCQIEGIDSGDLTWWLRKKHQIVLTPIKHAQIERIRVSPSVYTTLEELDRFSTAMERAVRHGIE